MKRFSLLSIALLLAAAPAQAAAVRFEAHVAQQNLTLDQTIELTVTVERDGNQVLQSYRAPQAPDLDLLHTGTSSQMQMSIFNGAQSVRMVEEHQYVYRARKRGSFTIGPAYAKIGGQTLSTQPIVVHVAPVPKNGYSTVAPPSQAQQQMQLAPPPDDAPSNQDLFVDARLDRPKVYVGEQVTATWRLYTQSDILKYRSLAEPKTDDFWSEDLFVPSGALAWDRQVVKGQEYAVALLLKKALFPLKAGKLTVTPLSAEATTLQSAFYANASAERRSQALTVEVMPLPAAGRPAGFQSSNVGQLTLEGAIDRTRVKAGDAITWRLTIKGTGNLRNVQLPPMAELDGFKVYDPTTKVTLNPGDVVSGEKVYTYLLMPTRGGKLTLPKVELPYFDPEAGKYGVARTEPVAITVDGDPTRVEGTAQAGARQENVLSQQIRPIHDRARLRGEVGERLFRGKLAWILLAAPPCLWLLVLIGDALRRRLTRETARSKRRRVRRSARHRLRVAEYHIKASRPSAFFGECARVIYEHLEYRVGAKVEALTLAELRAHLESRGFPKETAEAVVKELENCDFARFAPSASGPGEMRAALRRVRLLLGMIEKARPDDKEVAA